MTTFDFVGTSAPDVFGHEKVSGAERYGIDRRVGGLLHARTVRSDIPHGYLRGLEVGDAAKLAGVVAVITADSIKGTNRFGALIADQPVLVGIGEKVLMVGDPLALVVAESEEVAERAAELVNAKYEELAPVLDPEAAVAAGSLLVHPGLQTNLCGPEPTFGRGDPGSGFAKADVIVEHRFETPRQEHAYMEPEGGIAYLDDDGIIVMEAGTQAPLQTRGSVCTALGIPEDRLRLATVPLGGSFGARVDPSIHPLLALAVLETERPVRLAWSSEESFLVSTKRHPAIVKMRLGATNDGLLTALDAECLLDGGAYTCTSPSVIISGLGFLCGPYNISNVAVRGQVAYTNNPISSGFRGFGGPQCAFAIETAMNMLAVRLSRDPVDLRLQNAVKDGDDPPWPAITLRGPVSLPEVMARAVELAGPKPNPETPREPTGRGVACAMPAFDVASGVIPNLEQSVVDLGWRSDGRLVAACETVEFGEGTATMLKQIIGQELQVPPADIDLVLGDTGAVPESGRPVASRQAYCLGNATIVACAQLRDRLLRVAADELEAPLDAVAVDGGRVVVREQPERSVPVKEFVLEKIAQGFEFQERGIYSGDISQGAFGYSFSAVVIDVAADMDTGKIRVLQSVSVVDAGRAINPAKVRGQVLGGELQGIGYGLLEDMRTDAGRLLTPSLMHYLIPTALDAPDASEADYVEEPFPGGPYGARGVGEHAVKDAAPALVAAIHDAVGVWIDSPPATPEKVWRAIQA